MTPANPLRMLLLGGTSEAMALARALAGDTRFAPIYSVAGRTSEPQLPPLPSRRGGFGGIPGLVDYLLAERIELVIDATHPFAAQMSRNAAQAVQQAGVPLLTLCRPAWEPAPDEHWRCVETLAAAASALGASPRRVFLTTGKTELAPFIAAPQHFYLVRSVERPEQRPPQSTCLQARGPFSVEDECALLRGYRIDTLVSKNSGGTATAAKLVAARACGVEVIMVERPPRPSVGDVVPDVGAARAWLARHYAGSRSTKRGV